MLKPNFGKIVDGANKAIGVAAGIAVGLAITLSAAVHIKRCVQDLLPAKKTNDTVEIHVIKCSDKKDTDEHSDTKPEDAATTAKDALNKDLVLKQSRQTKNKSR